MTDKAFIYVLVDPRDNLPRYVGKTGDPARRLSEHLSGGSGRYCAHWIASVKRDGVKPEMRIVEEVNGHDMAVEREQWWVEEGRRRGWDLTNLTQGGEGVIHHSQDTIDRISATNKGRPKSPEHRAKIAAAKMGRPLTDEHRKAVSRGRKGIKLTECQIERLNSYRRGRPLTDEHKAKIAEAKRGKPRPPEVVAKMRATMLAKYAARKD